MNGSLFFNVLLASIVGWQNTHIISNSPIIKQAPIIAVTNLSSAKTSPETNDREKQVINSRRNCRVSAYVIDKDPQGLNVRNAPNSNGRVIKKLPTNTLAVFVDITGSQGQWVEVSKATNESDATLFQGKGWVYASLLGTGTRGYETRSVSAYTSNNNRSRVVGRIPSESEVKLLSCNGEWVYVKYQQVQGWLTRFDQCPNPLTTCP